MRPSSIDRSFRRFLRTGDPQALGAAFDGAAPELLRIARHLCGDEAEAEDALQSTFAVAITKAGEHDRRRPLLPWMLGILALESKRARERAGRAPDPERLAARLPERESEDPHDAAARSELQGLVRSEVERLPPTYAEPLRRLLGEGASPAQIARGLGLSTGAVHVRLHRGLELLRRALPAGAALSGALAVAPPRGLAQVRSAVLEQAAARPELAALRGSSLGGGLWAGPWVLPAAVATLALGAAAALGWYERAARSEPRSETGAVARPPSAPAAALAAAGFPAAPRTAAAADRSANGAPEATLPRRFGAFTEEEWLARFAAVEGWRAIVPLGGEVAALPDAEALELMRRIYPRLPTVEHRRQVLKAFVFPDEPIVLDVLDLAATDADPAVQEWAWEYLADYAYLDFAADPAAYAAWRERTVGRNPREVKRQALQEFATRLRGASAEQLVAELTHFDPPRGSGTQEGIDWAAELRAAGLLEQSVHWLASAGSELPVAALRWIAALEPDESFQRAQLWPWLEVLEADDRRSSAEDETETETEEEEERLEARREVGEAALETLVRLRSPQFAEELLRRVHFDVDQRLGETHWFEALGEVGDRRAVVPLVELLCRHDGDARVRYTVGYFALSRLTEVDWDQTQGCEFWRRWLEEHRQELEPTGQGVVR
jgi:RNA polymerase sigma factor (sigma-70 family)